jgi:hypothetical protein
MIASSSEKFSDFIGLQFEGKSSIADRNNLGTEQANFHRGISVLPTMVVAQIGFISNAVSSFRSSRLRNDLKYPIAIS